MRALLLAAGHGTRLRPLTDTVPKCLVPIHGRPLLDYWLAELIRAGVYPLLINLHYLAPLVKEFINRCEYQHRITLVEEDELLGTGGTILKNREFFENETLMLIHADNLSSFDIRRFIERHKTRPSHCEITMMTFDSPDPQSCGIVELDDQGVVQAFYEKVAKPPSNLANGAVYIIEPTVFDFLEGLKKEVIDFSTEVLPNYINRIYTFHNDKYHRDIGTIESYQKANEDFPVTKGCGS